MSDPSFVDCSYITRKCLNVANSLIERCKLSPPVFDIKDISSDLIVLLFESVTQLHIPDLVHCVTTENEAHNVQSVIDTLSLDLLGISLSHITGDDVVSGNVVAIYNLLEVLEGIAVHLNSGGSIQLPQIFKQNTISRKSSLLSTSGEISQSPSDGDFNNQDFKKDNSIQKPKSRISVSKRYKKRSTPRHRSKQKNILKTGADTQRQSSGTEYPQETRASHSSYQSKDATSSELKIKPSSDIVCQNTDQMKTRSHSKQAGHEHVDDETPINMDYHTEPAAVYNMIPLKRKTTKLPVAKQDVKQTVTDKEVEELYQENLENQVRLLLETNSSIRTRSSKMKTKYLQTLRKCTKKSPLSLCKKSFLLPHTLRRRSISRPIHKPKGLHKRQTALEASTQDGKQLTVIPRMGFVQELLSEFPGMQLSSSIVNLIRQRYQQHLLKMHKQVKKCLLKKPKTQLQADEVSKRQTLLANILKKNIQQEQYMKQFSEYKKYEGKLKYLLRDARLQSAKMKQYCDEFRNEMRKKMQKRNYSEELILENLFKEALNIQKQQVAYLCQDVDENRENDARQHLAYLDALENLYQTQFSMLSETFATEKRETQEQIKVQQQEINIMQREFKEELKKEIRFMQKVIVECMEDVHFRELDAEQFKAKLRNKC